MSHDRGAKVTNRKEAARPAARAVHSKAEDHGSCSRRRHSAPSRSNSA